MSEARTYRVRLEVDVYVETGDDGDDGEWGRVEMFLGEPGDWDAYADNWCGDVVGATIDSWVDENWKLAPRGGDDG